MSLMGHIFGSPRAGHGQMKPEQLEIVRLKREVANMPARPEPLCRTRPWETLRMSQATWYRKGKPMPETGKVPGQPAFLHQGRSSWLCLYH
jgi:hypothetical protein